jgi:cell volume regulation protein A
MQLLFDTGWETALIVGAVIASTDAAVVFDLVKRTPLPKKVAGLLEIESGVNDPFAILLTIGFIEMTRVDLETIDWVLFGARQLFGGIAVGLLGGWLGSKLLRLRLRSSGLYPLLALAVAGLTFAAASLISSSGFLAVYICGLMIGALAPRHRRVVRSFHASLANGADIGLFLLLGLLVFPSELPAVAVRALAVTAILLLVGRPLAVVLSLLPFRFTWREMTLASWAGLRGAVPIVLATFALSSDVAHRETIFNAVFFVVVASTVVQGTTLEWVAGRLGLISPAPPVHESPLEVGHLTKLDLVDFAVADDHAINGAAVRELGLPRSALIAVITRGDETIPPRGATVVASGDRLFVLVPRSMRADLEDVFARWRRRV